MGIDTTVLSGLSAMRWRISRRRLIGGAAKLGAGGAALTLAGRGASQAFAQGGSPAASPGAAPAPALPPGAAIVASGLTNPRGFTWGSDGTLYVALAGSGGSNPATEQAPASKLLGPFHGGSSGAVAKIVGGCPVAVATGLPSTVDAMGEVLGVEDVAFLGGQLYVSVDGGGTVHGNPDHPSGVYKINADGSATVVADLSAWLRANPVAHLPPNLPDFDPDADGYRMVADEAAGMLWVLEPNSGGVLSVTPDGTVKRIADLSEGHPVPSAITLDPKGGVYIGNLTAVPFPDGMAKVIHVAADGTTSDVWTGLTVVTGVAVGGDGTLYAAEMSTGNIQQPPFLQPGSGKIVRQTGPSSAETVASGLMLPISLDIGPDGGLYVSMPAIGASQGEGIIIRLAGNVATPTAASMAAATATCPPLAGTTAPPPTNGTPGATPAP